MNVKQLITSLSVYPDEHIVLLPIISQKFEVEPVYWDIVEGEYKDTVFTGFTKWNSILINTHLVLNS